MKLYEKNRFQSKHLNEIIYLLHIRVDIGIIYSKLVPCSRCEPFVHDDGCASVTGFINLNPQNKHRESSITS